MDETSIQIPSINVFNGPTFDKKELLERVGNDEALYRKLFSISSDIGNHLSLLDVSIHENNPDNIKKAAHKIKGAACNMSFVRLSEIAKTVEQNAFSNVEYVVRLKDEISQEWEKIREIIKFETSL